MKIIDGKQLSKEILENIKAEVAGLSFVPVFCDVLVGTDPSSVQYVGIKKSRAESVGMKFHSANFSETITTEELVSEIEKINQIKDMCGVIVQLPLPPHIDRQKVLDAIDSRLDVDCLGSLASEKFYKNQNPLGFPTALACMTLLNSLNLDLKTKNILVLGQGTLVGRPVTALLQFMGLSVNTISRDTDNKEELIKNADVVISGLGQGKYLTGDMVREGVVVVDAGTSEENGAIVGDVDFESMQHKASFLTPTPGGVGPVTVAMLFKNVLTVAKSR
jgi:methylenetetrahydrofolate dehydrogenase (NADP+)/methenyltetrahydrofolate cyclohydrolase